MNRKVAALRGVKPEPPQETLSGDSDSEGPIVSERHLVSCPYCITQVENSCSLNSHIQVRHWPKYRRTQRDTKWKCKMCRRMFLSLDHLATHLNHAHATQMEELKHSNRSEKNEFYRFYNKFVCRECGDTFLHHYLFVNHVERGHTHKRTHRHLYSDTKFRSGRHFFKRDTIPLVQTVRKLSVRDKWSLLAKRHIDTWDKVERFESMFGGVNK